MKEKMSCKIINERIHKKHKIIKIYDIENLKKKYNTRFLYIICKM